MWEKITAVITSIIQISSLLVQHQKEIDELHERVAEVQTDMRLLTQKLEHFTEEERSQREHFTEMERAHHRNNLLELENRILQMERRLPPANEKAP